MLGHNETLSDPLKAHNLTDLGKTLGNPPQKLFL